MSNNTLPKALERMGYKGRMTGHGFRGVASTALNEMGFRPDVIEAQLAHVEENRVRAAYNHARYSEERRELMQSWADFTDAVRQSGHVIALRSRTARTAA
jgi:integrase